ncbi:hypothetical protein HW561_21385 [Rhodobacteraceae bacterium B1Z28]|uniref:HAMP domain-containing protein n=1 Tax=Ruegeria haliotis TaxID=2747601 RepID=A0ABX2PVX4_9RHOB|nr:hypothetical protein [Ruegeria haliotis]NVO58343.1 hypothetical protein [Ruegeria haliotis]
MMRVLVGSFATRLIAYLAVAFAIALAAAVALTMAKLSTALTQAVDGRYRVVASDLRANIETGVNFGLAVEEIVSNVTVQIENRLESDVDVLAIRLIAENGREILALRSQAENQEGAQVENIAMVSEPIINSFGAEVGRVEVSYDPTGAQSILTESARILSLEAAMLLAACIGVIGVASFIAARRIDQRLDRLTAQLENDMSSEIMPEVGRDQLDHLAQNAMQAYRTSQAELDDLDVELQRLRGPSQTAEPGRGG